MNILNRIVATILWISLFLLFGILAALPFGFLTWTIDLLQMVETQLVDWQTANSTNFVIGQIALGVLVVLLFGSLVWVEVWPRRRRGVRVQTADGGSVELDTTSIARRLEWHLDQLADVITALPQVKARGNAVDIQLDVETAPDIDVPMKTDEVVEVTRDILETDMGLKLGKLDVRIRHAPFEEEWVA